jgi:hypothetical protein
MLEPAGLVVYRISREMAADARHTAHPAPCEINLHNSCTEALFTDAGSSSYCKKTLIGLSINELVRILS